MTNTQIQDTFLINLRGMLRGVLQPNQISMKIVRAHSLSDLLLSLILLKAMINGLCFVVQTTKTATQFRIFVT